MQFLPEAYADKMQSSLVALGYSGATLDMLYTFLSGLGYTGSLPDMWRNYLSANHYEEYTHDAFISQLTSDSFFLGNDIITLAANREFTSDTGFYTKTGTTNITGGVCNIIGTTSQGILRGGILTIGKKYRIRYDVVSVTSGLVASFVGNVFDTNRNTPGTYTMDIVCAVAGQFGVFARQAGTNIAIDNISVKEVL